MHCRRSRFIVKLFSRHYTKYIHINGFELRQWLRG